MTASRGDLLSELRAEVDAADMSTSQQMMYETWISRERWSLLDEALPLLVGLAPDEWPGYVTRLNLDEQAAALGILLAGDFGCDLAGSIESAALQAWARKHAIALPAACDQLMDYVSRVLPQAAAPSAGDAAQGAERELLLGAALTMVTRFPGQCRDSNGFFDGQLIADEILSKAALWFPLEPPSMGREEIATLLEQYLS